MSSADVDSATSSVPGTTVYLTQHKPKFDFRAFKKLSEKKKSELAQFITESGAKLNEGRMTF